MKQGIRFLLCALTLASVLGCDKNDDGDGKDGSGKVQEKSVLGAATKVGVFPDGTIAQPLNDQQMAAIGKTAEGAMELNKAVNNVTPASLQKSGDIQIEATQAFLKSGLAKNWLRLRATATDTQAFEQQLRNCQFTNNETPHNESGSDTEKFVSWSVSQLIGGGMTCPLDSNMKMDVEFRANRISDNSAKLTGGVNLSYQTSLRNASDQLNFDFISQSVNGRIDGEVLAMNQTTEVAGNGNIKGLLQTKTQGNIEAHLLFDLYMMQNQPQSSHSSSDKTTGEVKATAAPTFDGNIRLAMAVILKTNAGNVLLQVFATGNKQETVAHVYLNGKELPQSEKTDSSHSEESFQP